MDEGTQEPTPAPSTNGASPLRHGTRRVLDGYGRAVTSVAVVHSPTDLTELRALLAQAATEGLPVAMRGSGRSYGDAAINQGGLVLDLRGLNQVLDWDAETGIIEVEPGVTIEQLWTLCLPDGWWPAVVPGTMFPTVGGCVAMNIHGKNHYRLGGFGDQVLELDVMDVSGRVHTCSPSEDEELFQAVIGGLGLLGVTTRVRLQLKRVTSGDLSVEALATPNLDALFDAFEARLEDADYLVGWLDAFPTGKSLGRGVIHKANYQEASEASGDRGLQLHDQSLPDRFFGVIPRKIMWRLLHPWVNNFGMRLVNAAKYLVSRLVDRPGRTFIQSHVAFAFLLDYVPRWRDTYGRGGFIQVQPFVPAERARVTFRKVLEACHEAKIIPYLAVFKRHRPDQFLLSHALDGFSLAMDIRVTEATRDRVWALGQRIGDIVVEAGGRFYFAKDAVATSEQVAASFGEERLRRFAVVKGRMDPEGLLSSQLTRRILPSLPVPERQDPAPRRDAAGAPPAPPDSGTPDG